MNSKLREAAPVPAPRGQLQTWLDKSNTIDHIIQTLPYDCRTNTRTGYSYFSGTTYVHAYCKQLTCRSCARHLLNTLTSSLNPLSGELRYLVTLTLPGDIHPDLQRSKLGSSFTKLMLAARRTFACSPRYFWVVGATDKGVLHLHILMNHDLRRGAYYNKKIRWLKKTWHRLTGAHQVRVQEIEPGTYQKVCRYMMVNLFRTVTTHPSIGHRFGCSRGIVLRPKRVKQGPRWTRVSYPTALIASGYGLQDVGLNPTLDVAAIAAIKAARASTPLSRGAGGDTTPAGGRGGAAELIGLPVPPLAPIPGRQVPVEGVGSIVPVVEVPHE